MRVPNHIGLAVRDRDASLRFYRDTLGIEGSTRETEYGYVINAANGVTLTLLRGRPPTDVGEFHIGLSLPTPDEVRSLRDRGLREVEWWDEPDYVSLKVLDPDGYIVELAWDPARTD
jgi:catechol 2,3-dioxygenase-like lactoylglutathione lyase family enzyme